MRWLEAERRRYNKFLNDLADNDSYIWRTIRTRPVSISAYLQSLAREVIKS
jgi:hypothetical protein